MSIFYDKSLVYDARKSEYPVKITTNAGSRIVTKQAMIPGFGRVWFDERAIANIFAMQDLKQQHHITYDLDVEDAFLVHKRGNLPVKFKCTSKGINDFIVPVCHERKKKRLRVI